MRPSCLAMSCSAPRKASPSSLLTWRKTVVVYSEDTRQRDVFGKQRLAEQRYTSGQIDVPIWADDIESDYKSWCGEQGLEYSTKGQ